jgi:class 3 adenylate cyclase
MRFQTKLMLTLGGMIVAVTLALIWATGAKVRHAYTNQFSENFDSLLKQIEASRAERLDDFLALSKTLATHPYIIATLHGSKDIDEDVIDEFWKIYLESVFGDNLPKAANSQKGRPVPTNLSSDLLNKISRISVVNAEGYETMLLHPKLPASRRQQMKRIDFKKRGSRERLQLFLAADEQQIFYQPTMVSRPGGKESELVRETVATPVADSDSGENIGILIHSTPSQTETERFLQRFQDEFETGTRLLNGILVDSEIYSESFEKETSEELVPVVEEKIPLLRPANGHHQQFQFETSANGRDYLVRVNELTAESSLRPAYQIAAFPLDQLHSDLADLRIRGSGIGAGVLILGLGTCWLLAHSLSTPLKKLAKGTVEIRSGNLDHRVEVTSGDEVGELTASFNEMAEGLKQKALYRELLGKVSDESVAQALVSGTLDLELGGELKEVTVLFCDIRGFTTMTEHMPPTDVIEMLNEHMTAMTEVVRSYYGVVDKFVGDEIMAVFGALKSYGDDSRRAAECALGMIQKRIELNQKRGVKINIGIGVATGEAVAGCMGSNDRLNYTVLGARVNLASRLCSAAGLMEVVIDDKTFESVREDANAKLLQDLKLKGFANSVVAYQLHALSERAEVVEQIP